MNKEKLKELRSKISISLVDALSLLKLHNENIEQCIQVFHDTNIKKICEEVGCDERKGQSYYQKFGFDIQKIKYHHKQFSHIPRIILKYGERVNVYPCVGFTISAEDINLKESTSSEYQRYFAYLADCDEIIPIFKNIHPISNLRYNIKEQNFDVCCRNDFKHATIYKLIHQLKEKADNTSDKELINYIQLLIECFERQMKFGDYVVIEGNL